MKTFLFIAMVPLIAFIVFLWVVYPNSTPDGQGRSIDVEVTSTTNDDALIHQLQAAGVIDSPMLFRLYLHTWGALHSIQAGTHLLTDRLTPAEVLRRLQRDSNTTLVRVTIPEGLHRFEIAKRLHDKRICDEQSFLAATIDESFLSEFGLQSSAEGWLFPATYELHANSNARDVARRLLTQARQRIDRLIRDYAEGVNELKTTLNWGPREIIIAASIVEKEAAVDDERPLIASVFLNRLRDPKFYPKSLQADPTAAYGCLAAKPLPNSCAKWLASGSHKVTADILHDPTNAWSTYPPHEYLPPTAIANPGEKSIAAILAPAKTKYFYFVAKGGGRHTFSETFSTHHEAVHRSQ